MSLKLIFDHRRILCLILGISLFVAWSRAYSYEHAGKRVDSVEVITNDPEVRDLAGKIFSDFINRPLSYTELAVPIKTLQLNEKIRSVTVEASQTAGGKALKLSVKVELKFEVLAIDFVGNRHLSDSKLKQWLNFKEGDFVDEDDIQVSLNGIKNAYIEAGYLKAQIGYAKSYEDAMTKVRLSFRISEGEYALIGSVELISILDDDLRKKILRKLSIKTDKRLDREYISKRIEQLKKKLVKEGYRLAKISQPKIFYDKRTNSAKVAIELDLGPKIVISFKGNHYFFERDSKLKEVIRLTEEQQFSSMWGQSAKFELERFYKGLGYALVNIEVEDKYDVESNVRRIIFRIQKNNRVKISKVDFTGNRKFEDDLLREKLFGFDFDSVRNRKYFKEEFRLALKSLVRFYQTQGYLKADIAQEAKVVYNKRKTRVSIEVSISEGQRYYMKSIRISGNSFLRDDFIKDFLKLRLKAPYDPYAVEEGIKELSKYYSNNGFKLVQIYSDEKIEDEKVSLSIMVSEGPRVKIGSIIIKGNTTTDENIMRRELEINEGEYYSPLKISKSEKNIARLGIFSSVYLEETYYDPIDSKQNLVLRVIERKKRSLRTRVGYGSDEGLRGAVDLTFINIGGKGRSLTLSGQLSHRLKSDKILRRKESISYREPRLFGSKLAGKIGVIDEREEESQFNIDRTAFTLGVDFQVSKPLRSSLTYNIEYRKPFDLKIAEEDLSPFDESRKRLAYFDISFDYDRRDDIFNTKSGYLSRLSFDAYNRHLGSEANFFQAYSKNSFFLPIYRGIRAHLSVKLGFSTTYGRTRSDLISIPIEKRFRLGGSYSLRGFARNSVGGLASDEPAIGGEDNSDQAPGGNSVFNYNLEFILPFIFRFDLVLFTDGGEAWASNKDFNPFDIRHSAGFGLRYNTPVGPLRLDCGFILDRRTGEEWGAVQFAVGLL